LRGLVELFLNGMFRRHAARATNRTDGYGFDYPFIVTLR